MSRQGQAGKIDPVANGARTHLTLYLTGSYLLLIIYASLYPLASWRDSGDDPMSFLGAAWPRYYTGFDLATNMAAYLPFGFLCAAALRRHLARHTEGLAQIVKGRKV